MLMSKTEVFNEATRILGHTTTISDAETNQEKPAQAMRRVFQSEMINLLRSFEWAYYRSRQPLALFKKDPTKDWKYGYVYPNGVATILSVNFCDAIPDLSFSKPNKMPRYSIERYDQYTQIIYTNVPEAWAAVTIIPGADEFYDVNFGKALAAKLALAIAPQLITNNYFNIKDKLKEECNEIISMAQANDALQTPERQPEYSAAMAMRDGFNY